MGYESNFKVPDIDDNLLRGVDDLVHRDSPVLKDEYLPESTDIENPIVPVIPHGARFTPVQTGLPTADDKARQSAREIRQARKQVRLAAKGKLLQQQSQQQNKRKQVVGDLEIESEGLQVVPDVDTNRNNFNVSTVDRGQGKTAANIATGNMPAKGKDAGNEAEDSKDIPVMPTGNSAEDERERKRLKRLLRNRVSAQHARERKKAYMTSLENAEKERQARLDELENKFKTLEKENEMLREVIKTYTQKETSIEATKKK